MKFSYGDLSITFYWRYPNASPVEFKLKNPATGKKEPIYFLTDGKYSTLKLPDPKRKHTLCTIEVMRGEEVLKEVTIKATKQKYKETKKLDSNGKPIRRVAEFIKEQGRSQSLRKAIDELMSFSEIALEIEDEKKFRTEFWNVYKERVPKLEPKLEGAL